MIRNVKDVTDLLDRRFGSALGRPMSVLRTLVWVVVGVYLVGLLMPAPKVDLRSNHYNRVLRGTAVTDQMLDKNDPRGWRVPKKDPHAFTIAWIGGSSIQTVAPGHYGFLPADIAQRLPRIDGRRVRVHMYLMEASRIFDLYAATSAALASKPDLVVLDLNPFWLFNPNAIQFWSNLNSAALPNLVSDPGNWPLLGGLYSPSDAALSLASGHLASIRDRWSYSQKLLDRIDQLSPLTEPPAVPVADKSKLHGAKLIATMPAPLDFWNHYRLVAPSERGTGYSVILRQAKTDGSALNDYIVGRMLTALGDSKIPAIAYVSAVDPAGLADPRNQSALQRVETHLRDLAAEHRSRNLVVQWQSATRLVSGLTFHDMVHMTYDAPLADELSGAICRQLTTTDPKTRCTPEPRTAR